MDYFKNFKGFAPEGSYIGFYRSDPTNVAKMMLKNYIGNKVSVRYISVERNIFREIEIIDKLVTKNIDSWFNSVVTDCIKIRFPDKFINIQRIKIGDQEISEVDKLENICFSN